MSTIEDWVDDYTRNGAADTNVPQDGTTIATSGTSALGDVAFLDVKSVIRAESVKKGWEPDARSIAQIDATSFKITGVDLRGTYHPGQAVKIGLSTGAVIGAYVASIALNGSDSDVTVYDIRTDKGVTTTITSNVNEAWFSVYKPRGDPDIVNDRSYDGDTPTLGPMLWQTVTLKVDGASALGKGHLLYRYPDKNYFILAQCVAYSGTPDWGAFAIKEIRKRADRLTIRLVEAPGVGTSVTWQISTYYQIGG